MPVELTCGSHNATSVERRNAGPISLAETIYPAGTSVPSHYHPTASICLVLGGGYDERFRASSFLCEAGTLVFSLPGEVHSDLFGESGGRCFTVSFPEATLLEWARHGEAPQWLASRQGPPSRFAFELHARFRGEASLHFERLEELALALLDDMHRRASVSSTGRPPAWLLGIRDRVHDEFREMPSLEELASDAGVHRVHAAREFRRHFDCTIGEYARRRRLEHACTLLRHPASDLSAVAYAAGFADQAHMTRTFRRLLRTTPGRFRERYAA